MNKLIPLALVFSGLAMAAPEPETATLWGCDDQRACTAVTGPYSKINAVVEEQDFAAIGSQNTCCQLSQKIVKQICDAGLESESVPATCE